MKFLRRLLPVLLAAIAVGCGEDRVVTRHRADRREATSFPTRLPFLLLEQPTARLTEPARSHFAHILDGDSRGAFKPTHIHHLHTSAGAVWVFRNRGSVCLAQGNEGAVACTESDHASLEGVTVGTFTPPSRRVPKPHHFLVMGLVPDQVQRVVVTLGKRRQTLPVQMNLFAATSNRPILIRRLVRSDGSER